MMRKERSLALSPEEERLLADHLHLAERMARTRARRGMDHDAAMSACLGGLLSAVLSFNPGRGARFSTWAYRCMRRDVGRARRGAGIIAIPHAYFETTRHLGMSEAAVADAEWVLARGCVSLWRLHPDAIELADGRPGPLEVLMARESA